MARARLAQPDLSQITHSLVAQLILSTTQHLAHKVLPSKPSRFFSRGHDTKDQYRALSDSRSQRVVDLLCMAEPAAPVPPPPAPPAETSATEEEKKAAKRKEIEARLAALKLQQEKEAEQKSAYYGEHKGITCDGCGIGPIVGYRYHCRDCSNHDVCENCYDMWSQGKMTNGLAKQVVSLKAEDHRFKLHKDKAFCSLVKQTKGGDNKEKGPKAKRERPRTNPRTSTKLASPCQTCVALPSEHRHASSLVSSQ